MLNISLLSFTLTVNFWNNKVNDENENDKSDNHDKPIGLKYCADDVEHIENSAAFNLFACNNINLGKLLLFAVCICFVIDCCLADYRAFVKRCVNALGNILFNYSHLCSLSEQLR